MPTASTWLFDEMQYRIVIQSIAAENTLLRKNSTTGGREYDAVTLGTGLAWNGSQIDVDSGNVDHNSLSSLQGGDGSTQFYHLDSTDYSALTDVNAQLSNLHTDGAPQFARGGFGVTPDGTIPILCSLADPSVGDGTGTVAKFQNTDDLYVLLATPNNKLGVIAFGDTGSYLAGEFRFSHSSDTFDWRIGTSTVLAQSSTLLSVVTDAYFYEQVGIGTAADASLSLKTGGSALVGGNLTVDTYSFLPKLRQDAAGGISSPGSIYTLQAWDTLTIGDKDHTNYGTSAIRFLSRAGSSTTFGTRLIQNATAFEIWTGSGNQNLAIKLNSSGNVGITAAPISGATLSLGNNSGSTSTSTPLNINLGGTYADSLGSVSKAKLKLYDNGSSVTGIGVSSSAFEFLAHQSRWDFYNADGNLGMRLEAGYAGGTASILTIYGMTSGPSMLALQADQGATDNESWRIRVPNGGTMIFQRKNVSTWIDCLTIDNSGNASIYNNVIAANGAALAPSFSFTSDSDTGLYRATTNTWALASGGTVALLGTSTLIRSPLIYGYTVGATFRSVYVDSTGNLGGLTSSRKFKNNIQDLSINNSQRIFDLRPVTFNYRKRSDSGKWLNEFYSTDDWGVIAEEAAKIIPECVSYDKHGEVFSFEYSKLIIPMLHQLSIVREEVDQIISWRTTSEKKIERLEKENKKLKKKVAFLEATLT